MAGPQPGAMLTLNPVLLGKREQCRIEMINLLKENTRIKKSRIHQLYYQKYKKNFSTKKLGLKNMNQFFRLFDQDFEYLSKSKSYSLKSTVTGSVLETGSTQYESVVLASDDSDNDTEIINRNVATRRSDRKPAAPSAGFGHIFLSPNLYENSEMGHMTTMPKQDMIFTNRNMPGKKSFIMCLELNLLLGNCTLQE